MAIADTITSMQTHTSNAYTIIGYGTDLTGINKNLENLSSTIFEAFLEALRNPDTLFTNLPKKSGSGSNITLNDTANAPMRITLGASELTQASTTQLFDKVIAVSDKRISTSNGGGYTATGYGISNFIEVQPNTSYTLNAGIQSYMSWYNSSQTYISGLAWNNGDSKTSPNNAKYIRFDFQMSNVNNVSFTTTSPTPAYPSDIHTISGSNKVVVCGKNLFDKNTIINDYYYNDSGVWTNVANTYISDYIQVNANTSYIFQTGAGADTNKRINYFTDNKVWISQTVTTNQTYSFITPNNAKYVRISFNIAVNKNNIQIEVGSTATTYTPYVSQEQEVDLGEIEYCKIGNYEDKFIRTSGKNKLDNSKIVKGRLDNGVIGYESNTTALTYTDNSISFTTNTNYRGIVSDFIPIETSDFIFFTWGSATTTPTCAINYYDENKNYISANSGYQLTNALRYSNAVANAKYIRLYISLNTAGTQTITYPQVRFDSDIPEYEPYGTNTWYIKKNIGKVVLDGTRTISNVNTSSTNTTRISYNALITDALGISAGGNIISNILVQNANWNSDTEGISFDGSNGALWFRINKTIIGTTAEEANTYLSNNNLIAYYILKTPTYTQITGTLETQLENVYQKLLSYTGTTTISQINAGLPFNMSVLAIEG
jgi:hypothetical protein